MHPSFTEHPNPPAAKDPSTVSAPASSTAFGRLPPELSSWIFELVSAGSRRDVASCRLACRELKEISSPFLITTVVIANRLSTLKLAMEVMDHPYCSKHITHLLWDASWYEKDIALKVGEYQSRASQSSHMVMSKDVAYITAREADAALFEELSEEEGRVPHIYILRGMHHTLSVNRWSNEQGRPRRTEPIESAVSCPDITKSSLFDDGHYQDSCNMKGVLQVIRNTIVAGTIRYASLWGESLSCISGERSPSYRISSMSATRIGEHLPTMVKATMIWPDVCLG